MTRQARIFILLCIAFSLGRQASAQDKHATDEPIKGVTYHVPHTTFPNYVDVTGSQLVDGITATSTKDANGKYVKNLVIYKGREVRIDVDLPGRCKVSKVIAHCYRPNMNYKLSQMILYSKEQGQWVEIAKREGFWGATEDRAFALDLPDLNLTTDTLRLKFVTRGLLAITEIQVFGSRVKNQGGQLTRFGAGLPMANPGGVSAREVDVDKDGVKEVVLENRFLRIIFAPHCGGAAKSFVYKKTDKELAFHGGDAGRHGILRDQLWHPRYMFADRDYAVRVESHPDRATAEFTVTGSGGMMSFTEVRKHVTIYRNSAAVHVTHEIKNSPSSQTDYEYGFWVHNWAGVVGESNRFFFPLTTGVHEWRHVPGKVDKNKDEQWYYNPARGWTAFLGDSGTGMAATMEYKYLNCFYHWAGAGSVVPTWEWRLNRILLKTGESLKTTCAFIPCSGLKRVDGAFADLVGALELQPKCDAGATVPVHVTVSSAAGRTVSLKLSAARLASDKVMEIGTATIALPADESKTFDAKFAPTAAGTYVIRAELREGDRVLGTLERPIEVGGVRVAFDMKPECERIGKAGAADKPTFAGHELSTELVTPHIPWAKPYAKGKLNALVLCDDRQCREVVELWQRLEMDFTYVKFLVPEGDKSYLYCGDRSIQSLAQAQARLKEKLKQDFNVIILGGLVWNYHFDDAIRKSLIDKIKNGTGLIYVQPMGVDGELANVPSMPTGEKRVLGWREWQWAKDHPITRGLPVAIFPKTQYTLYEKPPAGEIIATIGEGKYEAPLIAISELGKGRVICLNYNSITHNNFTYRGYPGLTPRLSMRSAFLDPSVGDVPYHYWEYYFALLAKAATWAAHRESGVEVVTVAKDGTAQIASPGDGREVTATFTYRDRYSNVVHECPVKVKLTDKTQTVNAPAPDAPFNIIDVIVRDDSGRSLAWGTCFVPLEPGPIASVTLEKTELDPGETLIGKVVLSDAVPKVAGLKATIDLFDSYNRLLATETRDVPPDLKELPFAFDPKDLVVPGLEVRVKLFKDDIAYDYGSVRAIVRPKRRWDTLQFTSWNFLFNWRTWYIYPYICENVRKLGLDVHMAGTTDQTRGKVWLALWYGTQWTDLGMLAWGPTKFGDKKYQEKVTEYRKTHDKKLLVREPCLNDPAYRDVVKKTAIEHAEIAKKYGGAHGFCMGDEMSLTYYTQYFDFCQSPHCLAKFREWLKKKYGTLDALNAQWETKFDTWDVLMPMTADEVKGRGNYSPWADHRTFMEDTLAGFYTMVLDTLRTIDPEAKAGLSGTQAPQAGNGMDWWKLSKAFNFYHTYNTAESEEMRRSFKGATGVMSSPYFAGYWQQGRRLESRLWYCLLHDTASISAWTTSIFYYRDLTFSESGRDTRDYLAELKRGIWDMIRQARRAGDGIAVHCSQPSIHAAYILGQNRPFDATRKAWLKIMEDAGLQYDFIAYEQIEKGDLGKGKYKVLILPESYAVSKAECDEIRKFVQRGGLLISDAKTAIMDDHCRTLKTGGLDDVFGIERLTDAPAESIPDGVSATSQIGELPAGAEMNLTATEWGVKPKTAKPLGTSKAGLPTILMNEFGEGKAVYLNVNLSAMDGERKFHSKTERAVQQLFLGLVAQAGIKPKVRVTFASGKLPHCEVVRYLDGEAEYVGVIREYQDGVEDEKATIDFGRRAHVYDVRRREYLGEIDRTTSIMPAGKALLYMLLPKKADSKIKMKAPAECKRGDLLEYSLHLGTDGVSRARVLHAKVVKPNGDVFLPYGGNHILPKDADSAKGRFRFALNDPPGAWQIIVTGAGTGRISKKTVHLK